MSKPSACKCGGYRENRHNWRVIERREGLSSRLKCLVCGWKWYSERRYVATLPDHEERPPRRISDEEVLSRILDGSLVVSKCGNSVISFTRKGGAYLKILTHKSERSTYRFVEIAFAGGRKKIAVHRLVWMAHNLCIVPEGYDVDHTRGKAVENPDGIHNLRLLESSRNRSRGYVSPTQELPF